jgi:hypothetical protein
MAKRGLHAADAIDTHPVWSLSRPEAEQETSGIATRNYFIAASYILATYSQLTRWSMNALR